MDELLPLLPSVPEPSPRPPTLRTSSRPDRERAAFPLAPPHQRKSRRRWWPRIVALGLAGVGIWFGLRWWWKPAESAAIVSGTVTRGVLAINVTERGEIESSRTTDARCEVEGEQIKLVSILAEGVHVKKGQEVAKFDTEKLQRSFAEQEIKWKQALGKAGACKGELEVQNNKAESEIAKAVLAYVLAELEKEKYLQGEFHVELYKIKGALELAEKDLQEAKDKLVFYRDFEKKGFGTPEQTRLRELGVAEKAYMLQVQQNSLMVLEKFTRKQKETEYTAKAKDADLELKRTRKSTKAAIEKAQSDLDAAQTTARLEKQELDRIRAQLDKCIVRAPQDGILVYAKDRYWDPSARIQAGSMVYYRQTLFTIPDLTQMQIKVKVHESVVKKIHAGLKCEIVMDSLAGQVLRGDVVSVGVMAHQDGFWNQGGKEYLTTIKMGDLPESAGLKPGMTGEVKVLVNRLTDVLMAPVQAVAEHEGRHIAYVLGPDGVERRQVAVGENNDKFVEIRDGLHDGERIALDARSRIAAEVRAAQ